MKVGRFLMLLLLPAGMLTAQTVMLPIRHPVYDYLDRIETRYGHGLPSFVRPLSREDVARHLDQLRRRSDLAHYDVAALAYYAEEFREELHRLSMQDTSVIVPAEGRWHLLQVRGGGMVKGYLAVDLVAGGMFEMRQYADDLFQRNSGIDAHGYAAGSLGFHLRWTDNARRGEAYDARAYRTPVQGVVRGPGSSTVFQYEISEGQFTWSNTWVRIGLDKLDRWQGSGRDGSIILSDKVPSFPALSLQVRITDWLHLDAFHGWLFSDTIDVARTGNGLPGFETQKMYAGKYLASHALTARVTPTLQIAIGESIIYSDQLHPLFFIPVISYRAADRWARASMGNAQFHADVRYTPMRGLTLYGTGFVDELDASKIFSSDKVRSDYHVAYTVGAAATDVHAALTGMASESRIEFSRVYPYVYTNPKTAQQYTSHQVVLGHWIGANADMLTLEHVLHPLRAIELRLAASYLRFGEGREFIDMQTRIQPAFLYDYEYSALRLAGAVHWRPWHDVLVSASLAHTTMRRGPGYAGSTIPIGTTLAFGASYGIH